MASLISSVSNENPSVIELSITSLPKDCLYEIFMISSQKSKCKLAKTCKLFYQIKNDYAKIYIKKKYPLVWPFVNIEDYHEAIFRFSKWNKTFGLKPFLEKLDGGGILYLVKYGKMDLKEYDKNINNRLKKLYYMLDEWTRIIQPKNGIDSASSMAALWRDMDKLYDIKNKYFSGTSEEREIVYREIIDLCIHQRVSFCTR